MMCRSVTAPVEMTRAARGADPRASARAVELAADAGQVRVADGRLCPICGAPGRIPTRANGQWWRRYCGTCLGLGARPRPMPPL